MERIVLSHSCLSTECVRTLANSKLSAEFLHILWVSQGPPGLLHQIHIASTWIWWRTFWWHANIRLFASHNTTWEATSWQSPKCLWWATNGWPWKVARFLQLAWVSGPSPEGWKQRPAVGYRPWESGNKAGSCYQEVAQWHPRIPQKNILGISGVCHCQLLDGQAEADKW